MAETYTYAVSGMTCGGCARKVAATLEPLVGEVELRQGVTGEADSVTVRGGQAGDMAALNGALAGVGKYRLSVAEAVKAPRKKAGTGMVWGMAWWATYKPLILVLILADGLATLLGLRSPDEGVNGLAYDFMGCFLLLFSFFKLLNLEGFAQAYRGYDIFAKAWPRWGMIYPFVELGLGVGYLLPRVPHDFLLLVNALTALVMLSGLVGVVRALRRGQLMQCACLGTVFNLPMSRVTVIENAGMGVLALGMLFLEW